MCLELTFIVLAREDGGVGETTDASIRACRMVGDVNLFFKLEHEEVECEVMIAGQTGSSLSSFIQLMAQFYNRIFLPTERPRYRSAEPLVTICNKPTAICKAVSSCGARRRIKHSVHLTLQPPRIFPKQVCCSF
jgi:hypothetical protein